MSSENDNPAMHITIRPGEKDDQLKLVVDGKAGRAYWLGDQWEIHAEPVESGAWGTFETLDEFICKALHFHKPLLNIDEEEAFLKGLCHLVDTFDECDKEMLMEAFRSDPQATKNAEDIISLLTTLLN